MRRELSVPLKPIHKRRYCDNIERQFIAADGLSIWQLKILCKQWTSAEHANFSRLVREYFYRLFMETIKSHTIAIQVWINIEIQLALPLHSRHESSLYYFLLCKWKRLYVGELFANISFYSQFFLETLKTLAARPCVFGVKIMRHISIKVNSIICYAKR